MDRLRPALLIVALVVDVGRRLPRRCRQIRYREQTDGGGGRSPSSDLFQLQDQLQGQLTDHSKCRSHEGIY